MDKYQEGEMSENLSAHFAFKTFTRILKTSGYWVLTKLYAPSKWPTTTCGATHQTK